MRDRTNHAELQLGHYPCLIRIGGLEQPQTIGWHARNCGARGHPCARMTFIQTLKSKVRMISGHLCVTSFHPMEDIESCDEGSSVVPRSCKSLVQDAEARGKQL